jgi:hypothetical protein
MSEGGNPTAGVPTGRPLVSFVAFAWFSAVISTTCAPVPTRRANRCASVLPSKATIATGGVSRYASPMFWHEETVQNPARQSATTRAAMPSSTATRSTPSVTVVCA